MADTTTTTERPRAVAATRSATAQMRSGFLSELPPYFCTTKVTGCYLQPDDAIEVCPVYVLRPANSQASWPERSSTGAFTFRSHRNFIAICAAAQLLAA